IAQEARDAVMDVAAVGIDIDRHRAFQRLQPLDRRHQLHAVVGRRSLAAGELALLAAITQDDAPAARTRIAAAGTVGEDLDSLCITFRRLAGLIHGVATVASPYEAASRTDWWKRSLARY